MAESVIQVFWAVFVVVMALVLLVALTALRRFARLVQMQDRAIELQMREIEEMQSRPRRQGG